MAVDATGLRQIADSPAARQWAGRFAADSGRPHIIRVDRLDPSKNIVRGFAAFEQVLARWPASRPAPVFTACLVPSRPDIEAYARYAALVGDWEKRLLERYPGCVQVLVGHDRARAFAALRAYDVLCVNSLADGMNLVAYEGATLNDRHGVLVVSDRAGCSEYLGEHAIRIADPADVRATADALLAALEMPPADRVRHAAGLRRLAGQRSSASWLEQQLTDLDRAAAGLVPAAPWPPG